MAKQRKLKLLDTFCKAGGASKGYADAGFDVTGIDIQPQKRYPFRFVLADAMEVLQNTAYLNRFDVVTASPPCQCYSVTKHLSSGKHPDLVGPVRELLLAWGGPYVIENVVGAPLLHPVRLCGSSFGLDVRRHRLFESNMLLRGSRCRHGWQVPRFNSTASRNGPKNGLSRVVICCGNGGLPKNNQVSGVVCVAGHDRQVAGVALWRSAMSIPWMTRDELSQAIPPAYTHYLGLQIKEVFARVRTTGCRFDAAFPSAAGLQINQKESRP